MGKKEGTAMAKIIRVTKCGRCPHAYGTWDHRKCDHDDGPDEELDLQIIHIDCPLEDDKEAE
jgi:hypothetical protein